MAAQTDKEYFQCYKANKFTVRNKGKTITRNDNAVWSGNTVYGSNVVKLEGNMVYKWRIKIHKMTVVSTIYGGIAIGIDESTYSNQNTDFHTAKGSIHYSYAGYNGKKYHGEGEFGRAYLNVYGTGDIVNVLLDTETKTLGFSKNDDKIAKAFNVQQTKIGYSLAIRLCAKNDSVSILSFTKYNKKQVESKSNEENVTFRHKQIDDQSKKTEINELKNRTNILTAQNNSLNDEIYKIKKSKQVDGEHFQQKIVELQKEMDSLRNNRDRMQKINQLLENRLDEAKAKNMQFNEIIKALQRDINETNTRNQQNIAQLKQQNQTLKTQIQSEQLKQLKEEQREEKGQTMEIVKGKMLKTDLKSILVQLSMFTDIYTENNIHNIFHKGSELLSINNEINELDLKLRSFGKYLLDIKFQITALTIPNINKYKQWNVNNMIQWICTLQNGRFKKYKNVLRKGFVSDGIDSGEFLPDLDVVMLRADPFNVTNFKDRRDLANHFKSLKHNTQPQTNDNVMNNEGTTTEYH